MHRDINTWNAMDDVPGIQNLLNTYVSYTYMRMNIHEAHNDAILTPGMPYGVSCAVTQAATTTSSDNVADMVA